MLAVAAGTIPFIYVLIKVEVRKKKFGEQLPDALDMIGRSLRAGHPNNAAMSLVAKETPDPLGSEFGILVDEVTFGLDMRDALENMGKRVNNEDFRFVVVCVIIQHGTGGDLAEVLENVSKVIRDRRHMQKKIEAQSIERRGSALLLSCIPFFIVGCIMIFNPEYYTSVEADPLFWKIFMVGGALITSGSLSCGEWSIFASNSKERVSCQY